MIVAIYGASDDLIEIEGDISKEIDSNSSTAKKFYVYCKDELQFTFQVKFTNAGYWQVIPQMDDKTWEEDNENYCKYWDITLIFNDKSRCRYSSTLNIDSKDMDFEIERKRRKV
jgi:hypothetical protein